MFQAFQDAKIFNELPNAMLNNSDPKKKIHDKLHAKVEPTVVQCFTPDPIPQFAYPNAP
jgi:hypothetical protein